MIKGQRGVRGTRGRMAGNQFIGVFGGRPAAPQILTQARAKYLLRMLDNEIVNTSTVAGSSVNDALNTLGGASTSGAKVLITETITSGSQASVTFSSIPAIYRDLEVRVRGRALTAAQNDDGLVYQLNGDTAAHYDNEEYFGQGNTTTSSQAILDVGDTVGVIGFIPAASAPGNYAGGSIITFFDYRGTTFNKAAAAISSDIGGITGTLARTLHVASLWRSTAAITAIKVFPFSAGFVDNSVVSLYGHT